MAKAYCINKNCIFHDCEKHMKQLEGKDGTYTFKGFDATCRRYISWLVSEVKKDG
ncbi:MAG: hypothetical protein IKU44_04410 [Firmicutes bacterium]|nr:hypothetical protein [Bacillota bacterium]